MTNITNKKPNNNNISSLPNKQQNRPSLKDLGLTQFEYNEIKKIYNMQYILMQKIDHAKDLLRYSVYRIEEIAVYLSFGSQSSFTTAFKAKTGMTPNQYRKLYYEKEE